VRKARQLCGTRLRRVNGLLAELAYMQRDRPTGLDLLGHPPRLGVELPPVVAAVVVRVDGDPNAVEHVIRRQQR
jgi:hypothetical protein